MSELVRRGPLALPELIKHLDDRRPTKLEVGNSDPRNSSHQVGVDTFFFEYFSDEYDPRRPHWLVEEQSKRGLQFMAKKFEGKYTVKVADVCAHRSIVNRRLLAVRYQPTGGLVVNSPIEAPILAEEVRSDWGYADAEILKTSLLADIQATNQPKGIGPAGYTPRFINPALERLMLYFPQTYNALEGSDLKKREDFEKQEAKQQSRQ